MHNSQNSDSSKASFASAVLAQAILLDIPTPSNAATSNEIQVISNNIVSKIEQKTNASVSEVPTFHKTKEEKHSAYGLPLSDIVAIFTGRAKSIYERFEISSRGQITLEKANEYEIPYDPHSINFLELFDKVEEFELTIAKANEYGIDWKNFGYDLLGIEQEISEAIEEENSYRKYVHLEFFATRGV